MDDVTAGPTSGRGDEGTGPWGGGAPPPVLLAAMGAALLIAVTLVAVLIGGSSGGGSGRPLAAGSAGVDDPATGDTPAAGAAERVLLTVSVEGGGSGKVLIDPRGATCAETCSHEFTTGTRVTVSADPAEGSHFEGWDDACTGQGQCTFFMDRERSLTATFEGRPTTPQCEDGKDNDGDGLVDGRDPGCDADNSEAPDNRPKPASDCNDGRDNDGDGLVDTAQDPDCADGGNEAGSGTTAPPAVPPPATTTTPAVPPPPVATTPVVPGAPAVSECRDGRDNDGDGKVDRPADPGCDADATEAGG
jgi:Divergent InlB B-repeat domain